MTLETEIEFAERLKKINLKKLKDDLWIAKKQFVVYRTAGYNPNQAFKMALHDAGYKHGR